MTCRDPKWNYYWTSGNTEILDIRLKDENLTPQDLSGSIAKLGIKYDIDEEELTYSDVISIDDDDLTGEFIFTVDGDDTSELMDETKTRTTLYYAVDLTDSNLNKSTILTGKIFITKNVLS